MQEQEDQNVNFSYSVSINQNLYKALANAQAEIKPAKLDMTNPHFNSKYASLTSVQDSYRDILPKHGLCIFQQLHSGDDGKFALETTLAHSSGECISSVLKLILDRNNMQGLGSAITYARRYSICAMLGIVDIEDDDGNASIKFEPVAKAKPAPPKIQAKKPEPVDAEKEKSLEIFYNMVTEYSISNPQDLIKEAIGEAKKSKLMTKVELDKVIALINERFNK